MFSNILLAIFVVLLSEKTSVFSIYNVWKTIIRGQKKKGLSQEEVAKQLNTKAPVIGRYKRDEAKPSIEAAAQLANLLEVS